MAEETKDLSGLGNVEVEALTDEDLETAAGGGPVIIYSTAANACCPQAD